MPSFWRRSPPSSSLRAAQFVRSRKDRRTGTCILPASRGTDVSRFPPTSPPANRSPFAVGGEDVVLAFHPRVAGIAAGATGAERLEGLGLRVVVELGVDPIYGVPESVAIAHPDI